MKIVLAALLGAALLGGAAVSLGHTDASAPNDALTKVCPLTGEEIAADQCPLGAGHPNVPADAAPGCCPFSKDASASGESGNWFCNFVGNLFGSSDEKTAAQVSACQASSKDCPAHAGTKPDCCAQSTP